MKVAIYARESSDDLNKAPPIEKQIEIGKRWIEENEHELSFIFKDNGYSGGDWKRPDWNNAVKKARAHNYQLLWTWSQDRLARDTEQFLWFYRNLKEAHVGVFSGNDGEINMETAGDRIKHTSLAMASEAFRLITSDKVKRTYEAKRKEAEKKGIPVIWGRKKKIYDTDKIMQLYASGKGYRSISKEFGCSFQTIRRIVLQNPLQEITLKNAEKEGVTQ